MKDIDQHESYEYLLDRCNPPAISIGNGEWNIKQICRQIRTLDIDKRYNPDYLQDFEKTTLSKDSFNTVICLNVLEHVKHPQKFIENIYKILKPNGRAIISAPYYVKYHPQPKDYWRFTLEGLVLICRKVGLVCKEAEYYNDNSYVRGIFIKK